MRINKRAKFIQWLGKTNIWFFAIFYSLIIFTISHSGSVIMIIVNQDLVPNDNLTSESVDYFYKFREAFIYAPIIETLVFQTAIFKLLSFLLKNNKCKNITMIIIAGVLFGLVHSASLSYMFFAMIAGFGLMYGYIIRHKYKSKPFLSIVLVHALMNVVPFMLNILKHN